MGEKRDWRVLIKEMEAAQSSQNDSLELGDSWRGMPRRTEGAVNKTKGLYRRSTVTQLPVKNMYNFIIEKRPNVDRKTTDPVSVNGAPVTQPSVPQITVENGENSDSLDFSEFIAIQNNGIQAMTSTPYPLRQIDPNKSPKRTANVQLRPADSPKKLFVPTPTRIPIITPRTSRMPTDLIKRAKPHSDRQKMSSPCPVVSSTVHNVGDDDEPEPENAAVEQLAVESNRIPPATENADQNGPPFDEDQQEQDAGTKNPDEAVFRRPQMVRRPLLKQNKLDLDDDQSKSSTSQRNKKSKPKVNPLLEDYIKVGETIINRTNSVPLENSSSSSRRRLYKKGDSCSEEDILKHIEPLGQPSFVLNPISAGDDGTFTKEKSILVQSIAVERDLRPKNDPNVNAATEAPTTIAEDAVLQTVPLLVSKAQTRHTPSSKKPNGDMEKEDRTEASGIDQQNSMSEEHSNKQVLEEILEDWSDTAEPSNDDEKVDHSDSSDSENEVRLPINKQPETESKVRQDRSKNQKNQNVDTAYLKTDRSGAVRSNMQQIEEDVETDEDELSTISMSLRNQTKNASDAEGANVVTQKEVPTKSKTEPVHSTQHEVIEIEDPDSDESEQNVVEPSNRNVKLLRTKAQRTKLEKNKIQPPNTSRSKKRIAKNETDDNEVGIPTKAKRKAKDQHVKDGTEDNDIEATSKDRDVPETDGESEVVVPTKPQPRQTRKKRLITGDDVTEADGKKTEMVVTSKSKQKKRSKPEVDVTTTEVMDKQKRSNAEVHIIDNDGTETASATTSRRRKKNKRSNADDDVMETDKNEAVLPEKRQTKRRRVDDLLQNETDDNGNKVRSTINSQVGQSKKRKHESRADAKALSNDDFSVGTDASVAKKRKKVGKYEKKLEIYDSLKPRQVASGVRHSARERRLPSNNLLLIFPKSKSTSNRSALHRHNSNVQPQIRRTQSAQSQSENVVSMLLTGSIDNEPPLITRLGDIEITQGFHKTVKNNLVIHHIPGETGPSYGYFTLEPGMVKRACRISLNLHIHVVSGPVQITADNKSEQMITGSFASLPSGTKYSLRNDGENSALVFFSQHGALLNS